MVGILPKNDDVTPKYTNVSLISSDCNQANYTNGTTCRQALLSVLTLKIHVP